MILVLFLLQLQPFVDVYLSKKNVPEAEQYAERAPIEGKWKLYLNIFISVYITLHTDVIVREIRQSSSPNESISAF